MQSIKNALEHKGQPVEWNMIRKEFIEATFTEELESLNLDILNFDGELHIDETKECPHSLSCESMLKCFAIQSLLKHTGDKHINAIKEIQEKYPMLASRIKGAIKKWLPES